MTPERTLVAHLQALVHILADLVHTRRESFIAGAFETTVYVCARPITAYILHGKTLVVVYAASSGRVQHVSRGALAPEGTVGVYALATGTCIRHEQALVQIDSRVVSARSLGTQSFEFLWKHWNFSELPSRSLIDVK